MKIELVADHRFAGDTHLSKLAWTGSRHEDGKLLEDILSIDAPVNEFPSVVLAIESTILEREVITSYRDHVMWARTSRVDNPLEFEVPDKCDLKFGSSYDMLRMQMVECKADGKAQDDFRLLLPVVATTRYMIRVNLRSMIKIMHSFNSLYRKGGELSWIFEDASIEFYKMLSKLDVSDYVMRAIQPVDVLPEIKNWETGRVGDTFTLSKRIPFSLRTHLVRHRPLSIKSDFSKFVTQSDIATKTLYSLIDVQLTADESVWFNIVEKRSCWLAHFDMWQTITREVIESFGWGENCLPCTKGFCPYDGDAELRYTDADPNPPCPMHAKLKGRKLSAEHHEQVIKFIDRDSRPEFWKTIASKVK